MPDVPALTRGLHLLELLAQADAPVAFSDLQARLDLPRASLARMLAALHEAGWIERAGEAGWRPAARVRALAGPVAQAERLRDAGLPIVRELGRALGVSVLLALPRGAVLQVVLSETAEEGIALRPAGSTIEDLSRGPWGGAAFACFDERTRQRALARTDGAGATRLTAMRRAFERDGRIIDRVGTRGLLRIAVPVRRGDELLAVLGIGAPLAAVAESEVPAVALVAAAARLVNAFGDAT